MPSTDQWFDGSGDWQNDIRRAKARYDEFEPAVVEGLDALEIYLDNLVLSGGGGGASPADAVTSEVTPGQSPAVGTGTQYAREDHSHGTPPLPTPGDIGAATAAHGHSDATTGAAGFLSPADKTKLDSVASGATANNPASTVTAETNYSQATNVGTATDFARADHSHGTVPLPSPAAIGAADAVHGHSNATTSTAGFLSAADKTKLDGIAAGATTEQPATTVVSETTAGQSSNVGTSLLYARQDHSHGTPPNPTPAGIGAATTTHQATHQSGGSDALTGLLDATARGRVSKAGTLVAARRELNLIEGTNVTITAADNAGAERVDVTINAAGGGGGTPAVSVVSETSYGQASAVGTGTNYARQDHTHGTPALPTPAAIGAATSGHTHPDGTTSVAGFISTADKTKLDGIASGATVNTAASTVVAETAFGQASAVGVGTAYARNDHTHGTPAAPTPAAIGAATTSHQATHQSGGADALTGNLDAVARSNVSKAGTLIAARRGINLIEGSNVTLTMADNAGSERVDVTIAATIAGGGGAMVIAPSVTALRAIPSTNQDLIFQSGYANAEDGCSGLWAWNATSTATDDGAMVIQPTGHVTAGRRHRIWDESGLRLAWFGFLPSRTGTQNTASYLAAYSLMSGKQVLFPSTECQVAETTPSTSSTAFSALPIPSNATLVEPFLKLAANQNTFCRVFYTTSATATTHTDIIGGLIDGNYLNQPATEHQHAFFLNACDNVRVIGTHAQNLQGDAFFTYNGVTDCGAYRMTSTNLQRNGATLDGAAELAGDNLRTSIVDCTFEARVQPIDIEISGTLGATVSTVRDAYIAGNTCIVKTDNTMLSSTAIALAGNPYKRGNGVCVNNRCVDGMIYGWFGEDWVVENNTIVYGIELTATLNSTTSVTGLAVKGVPNGVPLVGYRVFGEGIPAGATFTAVNMVAGTATLSAPATVTGTVTLGSSLVQPDVGMEFRGNVSSRVRNNSVTMACTPAQLRVINVAHFGSPAIEQEMITFEDNYVYFPLKVAGMEVGFFSGNENIVRRNRWVVPAKNDINPIVRVWGIGTNNLSADISDNTILASGTGQGYGGIEVWKFSGNGFARNITVKDNKISGCSVGVYTYGIAFGASATWTQTGNEFTNCTTNELMSGSMPPNRIAGSEGGAAVFLGTGSPEGVVASAVSSQFFSADGSTWNKCIGATSSGWVPVFGNGVLTALQLNQTTGGL